MHDKTYGKQFKRLRNQQGFSLDYTSKDITSKSSLYYWEMGKADMSLSKVILMLNRIRIKPTELIEDRLDYSDNFQKLYSAYLKRNKQFLKDVAIKYLIQSRKKKHNKRLTLQAAIACNYLKAISNINLFSGNDTERLENILLEIDYWHYDDLNNFKNTLFLLPKKRIYSIAKLLLTKLNQNGNDIQWKHAVLTTLFDVGLSLLYVDLSSAKKLSFKLNSLKLSDTFAYEKLCFRFFAEVLYYLQVKNEDKIINEYFLTLKSLGLNNLNNVLQKEFYKIKQAYK